MVTSAPVVSEVDLLCREFFENPFPAQEESREAGPVVHLSRCDVLAAARYAQVHAILNAPIGQAAGDTVTEVNGSDRLPHIHAAGRAQCVLRDDRFAVSSG